MGHEVGDDIDIGDPGTGTAHAADIDGVDAASLGEDGCQCLNRRIEPFDVTDQEDGVVFLGRLDELLAMIFGGGEGFFDQTVNATVQELSADCGMGCGRGGDTDGIDVFQNGIDGVKTWASECVGGITGVFFVGIDDADQIDAAYLGVDADMMPTHLADSDNGDAKIIFRGHNEAPWHWKNDGCSIP